MTVQGVDIPQAVQDACLKRAMAACFKAAAIAQTAKDAGLKSEGGRATYGTDLDTVALRVADRLIQKWRSANLIEWGHNNIWTWKGEK
jgi:hypothetical protein